jgi:DNA (cytosine-5)-methyltransferase 1
VSGPLVLSIFPGIDLLGRAFEEAGFTVVRGPDPIFGGDIKSFHVPAGRFDAVLGGPPCQIFSRMRYIQPLAGLKHGNLIPEFERVVAEAQPTWWLMENVEDAPIPRVPGYRVHAQVVEDVAVGGATMRERRFTFGTRDGRRLHVETLALWTPNPEPAVMAGGGARRSVPVKLLANGNVKRRIRAGDCKTTRSYATACRLMGLPEDFLAEAPFTVAGKLHVVGNGVPMATGRALARAVKAALAEAPR